MSVLKDLVKEFYAGWQNGDLEKIRLTENCKHRSPMGVFENREDFLGHCWKEPYIGFKYTEMEMIEEGNKVVVRYMSENGSPICEWLTFEGDEVCDIQVFFNAP